MSYLYDGETHDNYDPAFMAELGMSEEVIASVLAQHNYELTEGQLARRQRAYVAESDPFSWSGNTTRQQRPSRHGATRWRRSSCATRWPVGRKSDRPSRAHHGERGRRAAATSQVSLASWRCQR